MKNRPLGLGWWMHENYELLICIIIILCSLNLILGFIFLL